MPWLLSREERVSPVGPPPAITTGHCSPGEQLISIHHPYQEKREVHLICCPTAQEEISRRKQNVPLEENVHSANQVLKVRRSVGRRLMTSGNHSTVPFLPRDQPNEIDPKLFFQHYILACKISSTPFQNSRRQQINHID